LKATSGSPPHLPNHPDHPTATPGASFALLDGRLFSVSGPSGASKLDALDSLDLFGLAASYAFTDRMRAEVQGLLQALEVWAERQAAGLELAAQPEALAASFDSLLRVMDALYQVRTRKGESDLGIDQLRETLRMLAGERVPGINKLEKRLEEVRPCAWVLWALAGGGRLH